MWSNLTFPALGFTEYTLSIDETNPFSTRNGEKYEYIAFVDTSGPFYFYLKQQHR
jgi:hypothetical protein